MYSTIVDTPIDVVALVARVSRNGNGATVLFLGTVRDVNDGRGVIGIEYAAYRSMAERELASIAVETAERIGTEDIAVEHRLGELTVGECSVAVAVAHPHRGLAFDGARYVIEELKRRVPIWKREQYVDGSRAWVRATTNSAAETPSEHQGTRELVDAGGKS